MPTVVYLCEYGTINGGENSMLSGLAPLESLGFKVAVACPSRTPLATRSAEHQVHHLPFDWTDGAGRRKPLEQLRSELSHTIPLWNADLVHANSLSVSRILGPVARPGKTRFVGHVRDIIRLSGQAVRDLSRLDQIFCVSRATRQFHLAQGLTLENSCVLHNGVDLIRFAPPPNRPERSPVRLVYLGQLVMRKGLDVLLEAARQVIDAGIDISLDIYGECHSEKDEAREYLDSLHRFVERAGLSQQICFRGRTNSPAEVLCEADVLVHPARQEPWGRVLLEAAASGLPIVATEVGGTVEMFPGGEAILVPPDDSAALGQAISTVAQSHDLRKTLGENARRRMHQFDITDFAGKLAALYQKVLP